jgi:hypothetical protein
MKSGGGVLLVSCLQLIVGLVLLGLYEGYKARIRAQDARGLPLPCGRTPLVCRCAAVAQRHGASCSRG